MFTWCTFSELTCTYYARFQGCWFLGLSWFKAKAHSSHICICAFFKSRTQMQMQVFWTRVVENGGTTRISPHLSIVFRCLALDALGKRVSKDRFTCKTEGP